MPETTAAKSRRLKKLLRQLREIGIPLLSLATSGPVFSLDHIPPISTEIHMEAPVKADISFHVGCRE